MVGGLTFLSPYVRLRSKITIRSQVSKGICVLNKYHFHLIVHDSYQDQHSITKSNICLFLHLEMIYYTKSVIYGSFRGVILGNKVIFLSKTY